jgi:hypothetical protein
MYVRSTRSYERLKVCYGAYVDLMNTKNAPQGTLPAGESIADGFVDVPTQDLRSLRRAVLDLSDFMDNIAEKESATTALST